MLFEPASELLTRDQPAPRGLARAGLRVQLDADRVGLDLAQVDLRAEEVLVPGRLDAALAAWLIVGRRIMARLTSRTDDDPALPCTLSRKLVSGLGISELVLLRRDGEGVAPLASGYLPLSALPRAYGYTLVPPDSEGYPAGARIEMRLLP